MIKTKLDQMLKQAIKNNDTLTKNIIRQIRSKVSEYCYVQRMPRDNSDDNIWVKVIMSYQKSISKALNMLKDSGKKTDLISTYEFEVYFCSQFLPKTKTEKEVKEIVKSVVEELNTANVGKIMGHIMKSSDPGTLNAKMVKKIVLEMVG
jgi:uncharacterized protein YqeY